MARSLPDFTEDLQRATQINTLKAIALEFTRFIKFDCYIYGGRFPVPNAPPAHVSLSTFPPAWRKLYDEREFLRIDPIALQAFRSPLPVIWDEVPRNTEVEIEFFDLAAQHNLIHGAASPVMGRRGDIAMFSVSRLEPVPSDADGRYRLKQDLMMFSSVLHVAVDRLELYRQDAPAVRESLTDREKEILDLARRHKTSGEIAKTLNITERTVLFHLDMASKKFGSKGRGRTIDSAIAAGELPMEEDVRSSHEEIPKPRDLS